MRFALNLCLVCLVVQVASCSHSRGVSSGTEPVGNANLYGFNSSGSFVEVCPSRSEESVTFDGKNFLKPNGWAVPPVNGRKVVDKFNEEKSSEKGNKVEVTSVLYEYAAPIVYCLNFDAGNSEIDDMKGILETPWFRELSVNGHVFAYIIFAKVAGKRPSSSNDALPDERFEYRIKDKDGDGIFETFVYNDDLTVPNWALN